MAKVIELKKFYCVNMWNKNSTIGTFLNKSSDIVTLEIEHEPLINRINVTFRNVDIFMCMWCDDLQILDEKDNGIARYNIDNVKEW